MTAKKRKSKPRNPADERMNFTKGQLMNIVIAAEGRRGACDKAKRFIKELKSEMRGRRWKK